jgi:hypothetical protein
MTLGLARTFAPNFGKIEKKVKADGTVETTKLSGLKGIGHAGLTGEFKKNIFCLVSFEFFCKGFSIIYESSENAAKHLATNLANETINVVKYK